TLLAARRLERGVEHERRRVSLNQFLQEANKAWHGVRLNQPDWSVSSHSLAFSGELKKNGLLFRLILNAYLEPLEFELLPVEKGSETAWRRWVDTGGDSHHDVVEWQAAPLVPGNTYRAEPRSVVVVYASLR